MTNPYQNIWKNHGFCLNFAAYMTLNQSHCCHRLNPKVFPSTNSIPSFHHNFHRWNSQKSQCSWVKINICPNVHSYIYIYIHTGTCRHNCFPNFHMLNMVKSLSFPINSISPGRSAGSLPGLRCVDFRPIELFFFHQKSGIQKGILPYFNHRKCDADGFNTAKLAVHQCKSLLIPHSLPQSIIVTHQRYRKRKNAEIVIK